MISKLQFDSHLGQITKKWIGKVKDQEPSFIENLSRSYDEVVLARNGVAIEIINSKLEETTHWQSVKGM